MSPWGLVFGLVVFLFSENANGAVGRAEGKSLKISVEGKDFGEATRVAQGAVAATDVFDELTSSRLPNPLTLKGKLVEGSGAVRWVKEDGKEWIEGDAKAEDFAAAWVVEVIQARIRGAAGKKEGTGSIRWVAEGCVGKAAGDDEGMRDRVAAKASEGEEAGLGKIQSWSEQGKLAPDSLTRDLRRLLAARLLGRATSADHRIKFQEWVAVGCPGKFWSDSPEEDGAWRRSLAVADVKVGGFLQSPEETQKRLRELAKEGARAVVRGGPTANSLSAELIRLEATADPFLRPAIYRYRQAVEAGSSEEQKAEQEKAWQDADGAVQRWREMRVRANQLLDWYELNVPDARWGPILRDEDETKKL